MEERREPRWRDGPVESAKDEWGIATPMSEVGDEKEPRNIFSALIRLYRFSPALFVLHLSGALIAWFAPDDALVRWPFLKNVVAGVGEIFPLLPDAVRKSKFPDVTALYFSLMLIAVPLRFWVVVRLYCSRRDQIFDRFIYFSILRKIYTISVLTFFACIGFLFLFVYGHFYEWNFMAVSRSRMWLGLIGPLFSGADSICGLVAGVIAIDVFFRRSFNAKGT
jgi:hypothetical protein